MSPARQSRALAPSELAAFWSVSTKTVYRAIRDGLPVVRLNRRVIRINPVDAAAWYATHRAGVSATGKTQN
ncbi:MAG: helix-turn-helix domain-containing protein [Burkholderiales bacterium]|nr:helix-turn-helix domain-containing protein [Opitutaceae bacterium]